MWILCEETYAESVWCKQIYDGLVKELKKRRISYSKLPALQEVDAGDTVYIIGITNQWLEEMIAGCNHKGCVPVVLTALPRKTVRGHYHLICPNTMEAMEKLKTACDRAGRGRVALYGMNRKSDIDVERMRNYMQFFEEPGSIYRNHRSLENSFREFLQDAAKYDAVICANGYTALSLVKKLEKEAPHLLEELVIISWEEVLKHSKYNHWIFVIDQHLESFGAAAVTVSEMTSEKQHIETVIVGIESEICYIPEKKNAEVRIELMGLEDTLYEDPELVSMAKIDQLMAEADDLDHHIIAMLLDHATYSEIADSCYMTEGNVKYRVKKYMNICGCKTKKELLELLQEYLQ